MIYSPALKVQTQIQPRYVKCPIEFFFFFFSWIFNAVKYDVHFLQKKISLASNKSYRGYSYWWQTILVLTPSFCKQGWEEQNKSKSKEVPTFFNLRLVCPLYLKLKYLVWVKKNIMVLKLNCLDYCLEYFKVTKNMQLLDPF